MAETTHIETEAPSPKGAPEPTASDPKAAPITSANIQSQIRDLLLAGEPSLDTGKGSAPEPVISPTAEETSEASEAGQSTEPKEENETEEASEPKTEEAKEDEEDRGWSKSARRRVDQLTARKAELQERLDKAEARVSELEQTTPSPSVSTTSDNPVANVRSIAELQKHQDGYENISEWSRDLSRKAKRDPRAVAEELKEAKLLDYTDNGDIEGVDLKEKVQDILEELSYRADKALRVHIPKRKEFITHAVESDGKALELFPWWNQKSSKEYQMAQQLWQYRPQLAAWPDAKLATGVFLEGLMSLDARFKVPGSERGETSKHPAPKLPKAPTNIPQRAEEKEARLQTTRKNLLDKSKPDGALDYIKAHMGELLV